MIMDVVYILGPRLIETKPSEWFINEEIRYCYGTVRRLTLWFHNHRRHRPQLQNLSERIFSQQKKMKTDQRKRENREKNEIKFD